MTFPKLKNVGEALRKFGEAIASVRWTAVLLFILIPITIVGSLIPQGREYAEYAEKFGMKWADFLYQAHFTTLFTSRWFLILIILLSANILGCLIISVLKEKRSFGFILVHLSLVLLIAGGLMSATLRVKGDLALEEGESATTFTVGKETIPLGFELRLKDFVLEHYENEFEKLMVVMPEQSQSLSISEDLKLGQSRLPLTERNQKSGQKTPYEFSFRKNIWTAIPGTDYQFQVERFVSDFRYDMNSRAAFSASEEPNNPAILVHMKGKDEDYTEWVFSNFSDFHMTKERPIGLKYIWAQNVPKAFISHVEILEKGHVVKEQAIEVNHPLRYKGFSIYQASYDSQEEKWSGFAVVRDPGTGVVFASIIMIMLGLTQNIYFHPTRNKKRKLEV